MDALEEFARWIGATPLYCFYNHVDDHTARWYWNCQTQHPPDPPQIGCTVAPLDVVRPVHDGRGPKRFDTIHRHSEAVPWRCLFHPSCTPAGIHNDSSWSQEEGMRTGKLRALEFFPSLTPTGLRQADHDRLADDDYCLRNLNWAVYRSVLAQEWQVGSRKWALTESGAIDPSLHNNLRTDDLRTHVFSKLNDSLTGLDYYKRTLQNCLEPQNCTKCDGAQCSSVTHTVLHLKGKPKLAASTFSLGLLGHENWGLTVVPLTNGNGHDVIWHHLGGHQKIMEECISLQKQAQGKKLQELASQCILRFAGAIVVSPEWWDSIGEKRRDAIAKTVSAETGTAIGTPALVSSSLNRAATPILDLPNPRQINLFRDK